MRGERLRGGPDYMAEVAGLAMGGAARSHTHAPGNYGIRMPQAVKACVRSRQLRPTQAPGCCCVSSCNELAYRDHLTRLGLGACLLSVATCRWSVLFIFVQTRNMARNRCQC